MSACSRGECGNCCRADASSAHAAPRGGDRGAGVGSREGQARAWRTERYGLLYVCEIGAGLLGVIAIALDMPDRAAHAVALAIYFRLLREGGGL